MNRFDSLEQILKMRTLDQPSENRSLLNLIIDSLRRTRELIILMGLTKRSFEKRLRDMDRRMTKENGKKKNRRQQVSKSKGMVTSH